MGEINTRGRPRTKESPKCPMCKQNNVVCFGFDKNGKQRYKCRSCDKTFNERKGTVFYRMRKSEKDITEAIHSYMRCANLSAIAEVKNVKIKTVVNWIEKASKKCAGIIGFFFKGLEIASMQLDEMWHYAITKANEQWIWGAIDPITKLLLGCHIGPWDKINAETFLRKLRAIIKNVGIIMSDGLDHYKDLILSIFPESMYARVIKTRNGGKLETASVDVVAGDKELIEFNARIFGFGNGINTAYIERNNLTCRQNSSRLKRKTLAYSKSVAALIDFESVYLAYYNFVKKHKSLTTKNHEKRTPAMRAGLTNRLWAFRDLLTFME